nr:hypothetical protein [Sedimentibacter sp.]
MVRKGVLLLTCIIILTLLLGCQNKSTSNAEKIKPDLYSLDSRDIIEEIDTNLEHTDLAGNKFNEYVTSEHFEMYYDNSNANNKIYADSCIKELEDNYHRVIDYLKIEEKDMPVVKVFMYDTMDSLKRSLAYELNYSVEGRIPGYALYSNVFYFTYENNDYLTGIINLFVHNVTMNMTFADMIPSWLFQGTAAYLSQDYDYYKSEYYGISNDGFPPLDEFVSNQYNAFTYGYSMVEYLAKTYGDDKIPELIRGYGDFYKILNITEDEFREGYKAFINSQI